MDKQQILDEIRRTAVDGIPLGRKQFVAQTGIAESYFLGRYWAKWSDAQAEAGFKPLAFNTAYDDDLILRCVLELTRKLGRLPTTPEMRLERRENRLFPNDKVITNRWNRATLLEKLIKFCSAHHEYEDIEPLVASSHSVSKSTDAEVDTASRPLNGYVYVIRAQGAYKIGCTRAPYRRAAEIASQSANGAELLHLISTDDPEGIEKYWHGRFQPNV